MKFSYRSNLLTVSIDITLSLCEKSEKPFTLQVTKNTYLETTMHDADKKRPSCKNYESSTLLGRKFLALKFLQDSFKNLESFTNLEKANATKN